MRKTGNTLDVSVPMRLRVSQNYLYEADLVSHGSLI